MQVPYKSYVGLVLFVFSSAINLSAQETTSEHAGFHGHFVVMPGVFFVQSNLVVTGAPLLDDVGNYQISSLNEQASTQAVPALALAGELNYTFNKSRTQLFFGNRIVDLIRLDAVFALGVRQRLGEKSMLILSLLTTPLKLKYWSDPFVEGQDRVPTQLNFPGFRVRWNKVLDSHLDLTLTARKYDFEIETSGLWLLGENRLSPNDIPLLDRNGNFLEALVRYDINLKQHHLRPAFRYAISNHNGSAVANKRMSFILEYGFRTPKVVLDARVLYVNRHADDNHPVFNKRIQSSGYGFVAGALIPTKLFGSTNWNYILGIEYARENFNTNFYTSRIAAVTAGLTWRKKIPNAWASPQ